MLHAFSNPSSISYVGHSVCKQWRSKPVSIDTTWHNGSAPHGQLQMNINTSPVHL